MENPDFGNLPEGCISHVIGFTSPAEACRSALVSTLFRSASVSDAVWGKFLPEDYSEILSGAVLPVHFSSKKELYFRLCDPILIDQGKMSFWLEKLTGKKCYMLSARELWITWGDTPRYWEWTALPESRFSEVAELLSVCWLEIIGKFKTRMLSPKTTYVVYLVLKLHPHAAGLQNPPAELSVRLGDQVSTDTAHIQPNSPQRPRFLGSLARLSIRHQHQYMQMSTSAAEGRVPRVRGDAWMELELGEFFNSEGEDGEVEMSLREVKGGNWKRGLIIQGIEIRPKVESSQERGH